ncbi:MAG: HXXEE domain-containing protein [Pseudomonadota bacterium]
MHFSTALLGSEINMDYQTLLILTVPAVMVHVAEEYKLGWVAWANNFISGITVKQFMIVNMMFVMLCIVAAVLSRSSILFSSSIFSLLIINSLAHVVPTIKQKKYSPGLFSAVFLFIPIGLAGYASLLNKNLMSFDEFLISIMIGFLWMSVPFIFQAVRIIHEKKA